MAEYLTETNEDGIPTFNGQEIPRTWKIFNHAYSLLGLNAVIIGDVEQIEHQKDMGMPQEVVVWDNESETMASMSYSRYQAIFKMR